MYQCSECGAIFDEPNVVEVCWETEYGVSSLFSDRHYGTTTECPVCGEYIDTEYDIYIERSDEWEG